MAHDYAAMLSDDLIQEALAGACVIVHGQAVRNAPIDTGHLRNSISWATEGKTEGGNSISGEKAESDEMVDQPTDKFTGHVGTALEYGAAVEYGRPDMPAYPMQPYLRPALAQTKSNRERFLGTILAKALSKVGDK